MCVGRVLGVEAGGGLEVDRHFGVGWFVCVVGCVVLMAMGTLLYCAKYCVVRVFVCVRKVVFYGVCCMRRGARPALNPATAKGEEVKVLAKENAQKAPKA